MSTQKIYSRTIELIQKHCPDGRGQLLDIGCDRGNLLKLIKEKFKFECSACDYTAENMQLMNQSVDIVNLNDEPLPYRDAAFDVVTCTEVLEHMESFREVVREVVRVTKPGGVAIFSTPNVLNLASRLRYLVFGFWILFGPLKTKQTRLEGVGMHINPMHYFYLAHALLEYGFSKVEVTVDKRQRTSLLALIFLYIPIKFFGWLSIRKEIHKYHTVDDSNYALVKSINSLDMLLGRTIIVTATR